MRILKMVVALVVLLLLLVPVFGQGAPSCGQDLRDIPEDRLLTRRLALLIGANDGGRDRALLRYAVADARAFGQVLEDMGGVLAGDSRFLEDPSRAALLEALEGLAQDVDRAKRTYRRVEALIYYSGHSDEESLFLGEERVAYTELKDLITALNADVRIAIFDSCASGAMILPKGVIKKPPFLLDTANDMKGYAFMTSSAAGEAAQESSRLGRSFFTHNLVSGMRGAADMNLDGRVTLNEAYQFAFDGTLSQTERTMAGAQHPSRHIQMSGTGDVVITEIRKSASILVLAADFSGRIFIHDKDGILLVELGKTAGREVSIGLESGRYRIFAVDGAGARETRVSLEQGKSLEIARSGFSRVARLPAAVRGLAGPRRSSRDPGSGGLGWRIEISGGLAAIDPADLNMRGIYDQLSSAYYGNDYLAYLVSQGEISAFVSTSEGDGFRRLRRTAPLGFRIRRSLARWLDVSVGLKYFADSRDSSFAALYEITELDGGRTSYIDRFEDYTLAVKGFMPLFGVHIGGNVTSSIRMEASLAGGPLFAKCRYAFRYQSDIPGPEGEMETPEVGSLEEHGAGVGPALHLGARLDYALSRRTGVFVESGYAFQAVTGIEGPGIRQTTGRRDSWEGEWGMKQMVMIEPWGTGRFLWPSNAWELFGGEWWRARDFKLDLSGFQLQIGVFFRF